MRTSIVKRHKFPEIKEVSQTICHISFELHILNIEDFSVTVQKKKKKTWAENLNRSFYSSQNDAR